MQDLFSADKNRANDLSVEWKEFYLDYSKNRITSETLSLLFKLAEEVKSERSDFTTILWRKDQSN